MLDKRDWYAAGLDHIWLPYAQMKTAPAPLPVVRTAGTRIFLADGRELARAPFAVEELEALLAGVEA